MRFILLGPPIAKIRHRFSRGRTYDPQEKQKIGTKADLMHLVAVASESTDCAILGSLKSLGEAFNFKISFEFHEKPPKSDPWGLNPSNSKCDVDNYVKFICDCCNDILFSDDHKIVEIHAKKVYNPFPKTIMDIEPMTVTQEISKQQNQVLKVFKPEELVDFLDDVALINQKYSSADMTILDQSEWDGWVNDVTNIKLKFAQKWGNKLNKIANKTNCCDTTKVSGQGKTLC